MTTPQPDTPTELPQAAPGLRYPLDSAELEELCKQLDVSADEMAMLLRRS
jgi:hypothetical protein